MAEDALKQAMASIKAGDKKAGKQFLKKALQTNPKNEMAWLWLSGVVDSTEEQSACLRRVLLINPDNRAARRGLAALQQSEQTEESEQTEAQAAAEASTNGAGQAAPPRLKKVNSSLSRPEPTSPPADQPKPQPVTVVLPKSKRPDRPTAETDIAEATEADSVPPETADAPSEESSAGEAGQLDETPQPPRPAGTYDMFISYSRKDKPFVQKLYETLHDSGREIWIDWGNIPLTADWRREIREGIERANAVIFVMSPDFLASEECAKELKQAELFNKRLIPLVYRDIDPGDAPASLASLNWIFARQDDDFDAALRSLLAAAETDLEWVKAHTRLLVRAIEWESNKRNNSFLLRGADLEKAEMQVAQADKNPSPTPLQKQYILASRQHSVHRQRNTVVQMALGLAIALMLAFLAFIQYRRADAAQLVAEEKQEVAQQEAQIALARQLGAQAIVHADADPALSALLSLKSSELDISPDGTFNSKLLANLRQSPYLITTLHGHNANVRTIDFNPDGSLMASGSKDETIILWDTTTGEPLGQPLAGHTNRITEVDFSPDGQTLVSSSRDATLRLWNVASRQPVGEPLTGHTNRINTVTFSPDGTLLASGGEDRTIRMWDAATGQPLGQPLTGHQRTINRLVFSPDGRILASASDDETIIFWDTATRQPLGQPLTGHRSWVLDIAFSPDGTLLASGSADRTIRLWDVAGRQQLGSPITGHPTIVTAVDFSPDGTLLASGSEDDSVILWDVAGRQQLGWPLVGHANSVLDLKFKPDGQTLASASSDTNIVLWDITAGRFLVGHESVVRAVDYSPSGQTIASGSDDTTVRLWNPDTLENVVLGAAPVTQTETATQPVAAPAVGHTDTVWTVKFSSDGQRLASGSQDGSVIIWDVATQRAALPPLQGHEGAVQGVAFSPDGSLLASGGSDNNIILWDTASGQQQKMLTGHQGAVDGLAFSPDGTLLASASSDRTVRLWDVAGGQPVGSPLTGHSDEVNSVAFSPDGTLLASGSHDNWVILWDVASGTDLKHLHGHINRVTSVAFSPNGQLLASGSYDKNVLIWDVAAGIPLGPPLIGHTNDVNSVAWAPDGQSLVSGSWDDTLILWKVSRIPWMEQACNIANRNFTEEEWQEFIGDRFPYGEICF